jgi:ELWxxDGT repeat protein
VVSLPVAAQTPYLIKDINTTYSNHTESSAPSEFAAFGNRTFFAATNAASGTELWSTDGTSVGTSIVADIIPGTGSSNPSGLQVVNGTLLFNARDVNHGIELWATDGTAVGTHLLTDINPGPTSSQPGPRMVYKNRMLFAADDGTNGRELWVTDGTAGGTRLLKDLNPGTPSSNPGSFVALGDNIYFLAVGGLWKTDGTDAGTMKVATVSARNLAVSGSQLFFEGFTSATGSELWVSDGSDAGTRMVTEIYPGTKGGLESIYSGLGLTPFRGGVLFPANDGIHGRELWFSDGTASGTRLLRDFIPGPLGVWDTSYADITTLGNRAYFSASDADHGREVFVTDGTESGTVLFADITPGPQSSDLYDFTATGGKLYFLGGGNFLVRPWLWVSDGTVSGTHVVSEAFGVLNPLNGASILWPVNGKVYFAGMTPLTGSEPWVSDGTEAGSRMIANLVPDLAPSSQPFMLTAAGNLLFFYATEGLLSPTSNIAESSLWRTDGSAAGTFKLLETGQGPGALTSAGGPLVFFPSQVNSQTLMMSDGTVAGTKPADDFMRRFGQWKFSTLFPFGETLFAFVVDLGFYDGSLWKTTATVDGTALQLGARNPSGMIDWAGHYAFYAEGPRGFYSFGLWVTDGTRAGTYAIVPDLGDTINERPSPLVNANGTLFFLKELRDGKPTLWKSDGTADGTTPVKEFASGQFRQIKAAGQNVFFVAEGSLWVTDGTAAGTTDLAKVTFSFSYENDDLRPTGNRIAYVNNPSSNTFELWGSDGTKAGTRLLMSLGQNYTELATVDGLIYFAGTDDAHGTEIWTTDGTVQGTKLLFDMNPGPASSNPSQFTKVGNLLYFTAYTDSTGSELWALPLTTPGLSIAGTHGTEGDTATALMHFNVSLSPAARQPVTVDYATSDGTAKAGDDYDAASGTITFAPGETVRTIDVRMRGDVATENNETFFVTLRNPNGAAVIDGVGTGIIDDDDQFADLGVASQFTADSPSGLRDAVNVSNAGPRSATDVVVNLAITPAFELPARCDNCSIPQLNSGASVTTAATYFDPSQQVYVGATAAARQRDPQSSNNTTAWTVNAHRTMAMNAAYLTPGATATVSAIIYTTNPVVTSSDPTVVSLPSSVNMVSATFATFVVTALKPGTSTIAIQGYANPLLVTVVAAGTQPRWPGAVIITTDFTALPLDKPMMVTVTTSGAAPLTGAKATGTVVVTTAGKELARATVSSTNAITFPVYFTSAASTPYVITYSGDSNFLPQTVNGTEFVNLGRVTLTGGLERTPGTLGTYTLTVHAAGSPVVAPTGTLSIVNGVGELAKATLVPSDGGISTAHATLINLSSNPTVTINYLGDSRYQSGSQQVRVIEPRRRSARH